MKKRILVAVAAGLTFAAGAQQNVGIGTTTPNHPLTVQANGDFKGIAQKNGPVEIGFWTSASSAYIQTYSPHNLNFATGNFGTRLTLAHATGFLGVNTLSPTAQLDVEGTVRLRNGAALGHVLTSDALGNATWQPAASGWNLTGNAGTNPATNFLGTTDNQPLMLRLNNVYAGRFHAVQRHYAIGIHAGINTTAVSNIALGDSALVYNQSGYGNIAIGSSALKNGLDYHENVAVGDSALFSTGLNDDGGSSFYGNLNVAVGTKALYANSRGYLNAAVGYEAGAQAYAGKRNAILGAYAMRRAWSTESEMSVAVGYQALDSTVRPKNTAVGAFSLRSNAQGDENVAVGYNAMLNNKGGDENVAVGGQSLNANTDGNHNTAVGFRALNAVGTGSDNTALGSDADVATGALSNATAIGAHAYVAQSNSLVLGSIAGVNTATASTNVGIGTSAPQTRVHVAKDNETLRLEGSNSYLSFYDGGSNYIGYLWNRSNASIDLGTASGSGLPVTISPGVFTTATFTAAGNVGIGTAAPSQRLHVVGNICYTGSSAACSDIRYKTDFAPVQNALQSLRQIHPLYYHWKKEYKDKGFTDARQIGFSAQEIERLYPEMVQTDAEGYKAVDYSRMTVVLLQAVNEQQAIIEKQQRVLEAMEKRLSALEKK